MSQYLGDISAYALAVSQGYTGTEEEYAELMASYATVGQTAVTAAQTATTKASEAATSATTATNKATEATTAATTATTKAGEASTSASTATSAKDTAVSASQTATTKATEATTAAATATSAATTATAAKDDAVSAKTAAQTAQTGAETAAASVAESAAQIQTNAEDISQLKSEITDFENKILVDNNIITVSAQTMMHSTGDGTIVFDGNNGFSYTRVTAGNNSIGFTIPTQAHVKYTLTLDISNIPSGDGVRIYVCPTSAYNTGGALVFEDWVATDKKVTLEFTAITSESSLWFYIRYNTPSVNVTNIRIDDGILRYKEYIMDYDGDEISVFNKIACVGDSITEGTFNYTSGGSNENVINISKYSYPTILQKMTGVETSNLGRGGNTSVQWFNYYQNADLSGYDAVIIMLGINDSFQSVSVSDFSDAICDIIDKFKAENTGIKVFLSTIVPAYTNYNRRFDDYNAEIRRIVLEEYTDVFLIDINKYSICKYYTYYAQGHLTAIGYQQLAKEFATLISYTIHNNLADFRNIQFIGTEYDYINA